jgi:outer membrane protein OmpA-like peptidoglycan-associated protein
MGVSVTEKGCPTDSDEDGIADYLDQCPNTPSNILVDSVGCPVDNDKDGVADYVDLCLGTPENVKVDENGCPIDTDKDGVPDFVDQCPETPENTPVNKEGCPLDSDGDGINDGLDKCPQKPGPISNFGCPELKKEVRNLFKKAMTGIQFESGKDIIKKSSYPILDDIVKVMSENADYNLTINGYTDNVGDDEKNLNLSKARATAVLNYIANKGIDAKRLSAFGFGEANPIADNNTSKGRSLNRRVEFEISYTEISYETINTLPTE